VTPEDDLSIEHLAQSLDTHSEASRELAQRLPSRGKARLLVGVAVLALIAAATSGVGVWLIRDTQLSSVRSNKTQHADSITISAEAATIAAQSRDIAIQDAQLGRQGQFDGILGRFLITILSQPHIPLTPAEQKIKTDLQRFLAATPKIELVPVPPSTIPPGPPAATTTTSSPPLP
jgi:hypothetical protein